MIESKVVSEWKAEGKVEGKVEGEQNLLIRAIERRYGAVPSDLAILVRSTKNLESIHSWFDHVFQANTLDEFRQNASI